MHSDERSLEQLSETYDPQIARLPHPQRIMAAMAAVAEAAGKPFQGEDFYALLLGSATYYRLLELLAQYPLNGMVIEQLSREDRSFAHFARNSMEAPGSTYSGNLWWLLDYLRWRTQGRHLFQTTDALDQMLASTDMGEGIPAHWIRAPYAIQYLQCTESLSSPLQLWHAQSGEHRLEGGYILTGVVPEPLPEAGQRYLEMVLTGSPLGKRNNTDDCTSSITLVVPDEDATMLEVLEHSLAKNDERKGASEEEKRYLRPAIFHMAKILLYLNSNQVLRSEVPERSLMEARLKGLKGGGKRAKLLRQLPRAYDRIIIGPKTRPSPSSGSGETGRRLPAHWRRGHFRHQPFGEGRAQHRLIWIAPLLVHADEALTVEGKPYLLKTRPGGATKENSDGPTQA